MDLQLHGRTAVVTGASRGIGLAVSRALAHEGVREVGAARTITPELDEATVATVSADCPPRMEPRPWWTAHWPNWAASTS